MYTIWFSTGLTVLVVEHRIVPNRLWLYRYSIWGFHLGGPWGNPALGVAYPGIGGLRSRSLYAVNLNPKWEMYVSFERTNLSGYDICAHTGIFYYNFLIDCCTLIKSIIWFGWVPRDMPITTPYLYCTWYIPIFFFIHTPIVFGYLYFYIKLYSSHRAMLAHSFPTQVHQKTGRGTLTKERAKILVASDLQLAYLSWWKNFVLQILLCYQKLML